MEWTKFVKMEVPESIKEDVDEVWKNNRYEVQLKFIDKEKGSKGYIWLQFKDAINKDALHDWREMQRIKNELCGTEREAVELFPAESRLVDTANQFHLFVLPEGEQTGFGYQGRLVVKGHNNFVYGVGGSRQREFEEGSEPEDAMTNEELKEKMKDLGGDD